MKIVKFYVLEKKTYTIFYHHRFPIILLTSGAIEFAVIFLHYKRRHAAVKTHVLHVFKFDKSFGQNMERHFFVHD